MHYRGVAAYPGKANILMGLLVLLGISDRAIARIDAPVLSTSLSYGVQLVSSYHFMPLPS